jgi:hypothetical protein
VSHLCSCSRRCRTLRLAIIEMNLLTREVEVNLATSSSYRSEIASMGVLVSRAKARRVLSRNAHGLLIVRFPPHITTSCECASLQACTRPVSSARGVLLSRVSGIFPTPIRQRGPRVLPPRFSQDKRACHGRLRAPAIDRRAREGGEHGVLPEGVRAAMLQVRGLVNRGELYNA